MNAKALSERRKELEKQADKENLDWKDRIKGMKDDHLIVLALATILGFNLRGVLDPSKSIAELEKHRREVQAAERSRAALWQAANR
jgi:hypothetical protein